MTSVPKNKASGPRDVHEPLATTVPVISADAGRSRSLKPLRILLLCDDYRGHANTVLDHIHAFAQHSEHSITAFNPRQWPFGLGRLANDFDVLVIHYSLCVIYEHYLPRRVEEAIKGFPGLKVQFIQDEHRWVNRIVDKLDELGIHVLFTCVPDGEVDKIYGRLRELGLVTVRNLPGYIPQKLVGRAVPAIVERPFHVTYRGRELPFWMGTLTQEKWLIAREFMERAPHYGLECDVAWREHDRIYGERWIRLMTSGKAVLGTESGASIADFDGEVESRVGSYVAAHPSATFDAVAREVLHEFEGNVVINAISPRVFEAACLRTALVLYPGHYSGVLVPERHYIPLAKDFSNMGDVAAHLKDDRLLQELVDRTYEEIVASGVYSYAAFIRSFDQRVTDEFAARYGAPRSDSSPTHIDGMTASWRVRARWALLRWLAEVPRKLTPVVHAARNRLFAYAARTRLFSESWLVERLCNYVGVQRLVFLTLWIGVKAPWLLSTLAKIYRRYADQRLGPPFTGGTRRETSKCRNSRRATRAPSRSVLFLHHSYYHFYYLARALRERGWDALCVSLEPPDSEQLRFYHGEDLNLYDPDPRRFRANLEEFFETIKHRFRLVHFAGDGVMGLFPENWDSSPMRDRVPWDFLELRRHGMKIAYTVSGCNDGVRQSAIHEYTHGLCDKCIWQDNSEVCSDKRNYAWGKKLYTICDLITTETDWALEYRRGRKVFHEPLVMCLDPSLWDPQVEVPEELRLERQNDELIVYHAFGNYEPRTQAGRNIKGSRAIMAAIERLRAQGLPVRLYFARDIQSRLVRFVQVQADIVVDQLNYGRYGANAREAMMLGKPTICYIDPRQPRPLRPLRSLAECPLVSATEDTVYETLKDLAVSPEKRARLGSASRAYALKWHSTQACSARYERVYDRIMSSRRPNLATAL